MGRPMMWLLPLLMACAPRTPAVAAPAAVEARGVEAAALVDLADQLEAGDALDRAGADLARALAEGSADARTRETAVELLVELRDRPEPVAEVEPGEPPVETVDSGGFDSTEGDTAVPEGVEADARAAEVIAEHQVVVARDALRVGDWLGAIDALEPLRDTPSWTLALPYYEEAVDGHVGAERERIGEAYLAARSLPREQRLVAMREVRDALDELLRTWPGSAYEVPLQDNLARVERELSALEGL